MLLLYANRSFKWCFVYKTNLSNKKLPKMWLSFPQKWKLYLYNCSSSNSLLKSTVFPPSVFNTFFAPFFEEILWWFYALALVIYKRWNKNGIEKKLVVIFTTFFWRSLFLLHFYCYFKCKLFKTPKRAKTVLNSRFFFCVSFNKIK